MSYNYAISSDAIYAAGTIDFLRTVDGENPVRIQPKAPSRDKGAR